jgi:hypothetical protein
MHMYCLVLVHHSNVKSNGHSINSVANLMTNLVNLKLKRKIVNSSKIYIKYVLQEKKKKKHQHTKIFETDFLELILLE